MHQCDELEQRGADSGTGDPFVLGEERRAAVHLRAGDAAPGFEGWLEPTAQKRQEGHFRQEVCAPQHVAEG